MNSLEDLREQGQRYLKRSNNIEDTECLEFGDLVLDVKNAKLKCNDNEIQISGKELELLEQFLLNKNQVLSRENLVERIWGYESEAEYNNVEVYITFIRRKLKLIDSEVSIKAVRGIGYRLEAKNDK